MLTFDLHFKADDNKDYFYYVFDLENKKAILIKNASCVSVVEKFISDNGICEKFIVYFNGDSDVMDFRRIPKKYFKFSTEDESYDVENDDPELDYDNAESIYFMGGHATLEDYYEAYNF